MKKLVSFFIIMMSILFLFGCSKVDKDLNLLISEKIEMENTTQTTYYNDLNIVLPKVKVDTINLAKKFNNVNISNYTIANTFNNVYYGYKSSYINGNINDEFMLLDYKSGKELYLKYPENISNWTVGSGSTVVLQDRYLYEWKSYTSEFSQNATYDVKLTRIDCESGIVEIIDESNHSTPLIYLCKISDTEILSYSITKAPSDKTEYAVISSAWIYNINGEKKEIINEKYENDISWTDSQGTLIERFAIKDGKLFGFGRRLISGKYQFFLYHYDNSGKLLKEENLINFENIIGAEQLLELHLMGNYIVFRTYESLTTYICKKTDIGVELIMKGVDQQVQYAVVMKYIVFIESNVNVYSGEVEDKDCPLYIIDAEKEKIYATKFFVNLNFPYFVSIQALDAGLLVKYCDDGIYNPMKIIHYIIDSKTLESELSNLK